MDTCNRPLLYPSCEECPDVNICDDSIFMEVQEKEKKRNANNNTKKTEM